MVHYKLLTLKLSVIIGQQYLSFIFHRNYCDVTFSRQKRIYNIVVGSKVNKRTEVQQPTHPFT